MCLFYTIFLLLGPRAAIVFWWIAEPSRWALTFQSAFVPLMGLLFLPWTTLFYVLVYPGGIEGLDWLWLGIGLVVDIASYGGGAYGNRDRDQYGVGPYGT